MAKSYKSYKRYKSYMAMGGWLLFCHPDFYLKALLACHKDRCFFQKKDRYLEAVFAFYYDGFTG